MCTITLIARRNGYALGMNRDEKLTRVAALPPAQHRVGSRDALFPSEPSGGTWIGVNDVGVTLALINWYSVAARVVRQPVTRGEVVKLALLSDSAAMADASLTRLPLALVNPFRLIGVFPANKAVVEWRWNLKRLERIDHHWRTNTWISSGFDERGAQQMRGSIFGEALHHRSVGTANWLRRLHRSHGSGCGPYSTCMHRKDAATVSYTEVQVSRHRATMRYTADAPCRTASMSDSGLQLDL